MRLTVPHLTALCIAVLSACGDAHAQDRGEQPTRVDLSVTGGYISGNLHQAQLQSRLHLSHSTATSGVDLIGSAFRLWRPLTPDARLEKVGDDQSLLALPFYYLGKRPYLLGLARVERAGLRMMENRMNGGAGIGLAPVREVNRLIRFAAGAQLERTEYASELMSPEWAGSGSTRTTPRLFTVGNGWFRPQGSPIGGFFVGAFLVNPAEMRDLRGRLDAGVDFQLSKTLSTRLAVNIVHESVVPAGLKTTDLRSTVGFAWKSPAKK